MAKNPINLIMVFLIELYKKVFSFYLGGRCRFYPSCSNYALEAYKRKNFFVATYLMIKRILKCHPLGPYGVDVLPVERKHNAK